MCLVDNLQLDENIHKEKSEQEQFEAFAQYIDHLAQTDFNKLLNILYRIDVSEEKVKKALAENQNKVPAGQVIAKLLIERETEKIKLRAKYSKK